MLVYSVWENCKGLFLLRWFESRVWWQIRTLTGHVDTVASVAFSLDGMRIVSGSWDTNVNIWDAKSGVKVRSFLGLR